MDTKELVQWIRTLYLHNNIKAFYNNIIWRVPRAEVLHDQHNECQMCKARGLVEEATMVHHIKYVKYHPELALDKDNLMALCKECHYQIHHTIKYKKQLNIERW